MARELDLESGEGGEPTNEPKKPRGRPSTNAVSGDLKKSISEGLAEFSEWLKGRDPELAAKVKDGAPQMAEFLAHHAAKRARVAKVVKFVFAKGGPFAALRAFGPTLRAVSDRLSTWRHQQPVAGEWEEEPGGGDA